jgi:hypothetical protein
MPYAANGKISTDPFEGAIEITQDQYQEALAGIMSGKIITVDGGFSVIDVPEPPVPEPEPELPLTYEELQALRQSAYSAEADPIAMQMLRDEATKEEWLAKIDEIKARYPYPEE